MAGQVRYVSVCLCVCVARKRHTRHMPHTESENKRPNLPQRIVRCLRVVPEGLNNTSPPTHTRSPDCFSLSFVSLRLAPPRFVLLSSSPRPLLSCHVSFRFAAGHKQFNRLPFRWHFLYFLGLPFFVSSLSPARPAVATTTTATTTAAKRGTHRARNVLSFPLSSSFLCDK